MAERMTSSADGSVKHTENMTIPKDRKDELEGCSLKSVDNYLRNGANNATNSQASRNFC